MLKHQEIEEEQNAAQARVTPRELAEALTSLESRQAADAHRQADSIALGEAIRQLDIDATAEELLREVRALRTARAESKRTKLDPVMLIAAVIVTLMLFLPTLYVLISAQFSQPARAAATPSPSMQSVSAAATEDFPLLSQVSLGMPVGVEYSTLTKLARNPNALDVRVNARLTNGGAQWSGPFWTVKRTANGLVVDCWAHDIEALRYANGEGAKVFSSPLHAEGGAASIEIPITDFQGALEFARIDHGSEIRTIGVKLRANRSR